MRPPSRPPPSFTRVCGAAAASRQGKMAVLHEAALYGHACCVESLLKAGANASLKNEVSGGAEGRGGKRLGSGRGTERVWGRGLVQASRRLSAPPCPRPLPSSPGCLYPPPPPSPLSLSQWRQTALDLAKQENHTETVRLLENAPAIAQGSV